MAGEQTAPAGGDALLRGTSPTAVAPTDHPPNTTERNHTRSDNQNRCCWWHSTPTLGASLLPIRDDAPGVLHWETGDEIDYAVGQIYVPLDAGQAPVTVHCHLFFVGLQCWIVWDEFEDVPDDQVIWENFHLATRNIRIEDADRSVETAFPEGPNLLMRVATEGWQLNKEDTRMSPGYGPETEPTLTAALRGQRGDGLARVRGSLRPIQRRRIAS